MNLCIYSLKIFNERIRSTTYHSLSLSIPLSLSVFCEPSVRAIVFVHVPMYVGYLVYSELIRNVKTTEMTENGNKISMNFFFFSLHNLYRIMNNTFR